MHPQQSSHAFSLQSPATFWSHHAEQLSWHRQPSSTIHTHSKDQDKDQGKDQEQQYRWTWFPDGEISTAYNCVDRHVHDGHGETAAIVYDSPVTGTKEKYTYAELLDEVEVLAGALREEGVSKGDVVIIYSKVPMIPSALIAALAIIRLGAIHAAVFGGFAAQSLAQRIEAARPKAIMTASCGIEGTRVIPYRPLVERALQLVQQNQSQDQTQGQGQGLCKTFIWQRDQCRWNQPDKRGGQRNWQRVVKSARFRGVRADAVPVRSDEGVYIIYTSGTTGLPKGVLREAAGHAVGLHLSMHQLFDLQRGEVIFCASDIGWVVGHSYILYGPLLVGATTVLFEGKPVGTPDASTFWRIVEEHRVNVLFTAPTALRAIRRDDPANTHFETVARRNHHTGLRSLRALFLAGERSEPSIVSTFQALLAAHAAPNATVVDNWWSSESGSPMTGLALNSTIVRHRDQHHQRVPAPRMKPGSAGLPLPGFDIRIVDDEGHPQEANTMGNIVLGLPLAPTAFTRLFGDAHHARFYKSYLARFHGRWFDTGDAGLVDPDGYVHVMARSDDIINVAAHRFSTGAIEQVLLSHGQVAEAVVVGVPDALKGHLPFAFIAPASAGSASASKTHDLHAQLNDRVRSQIGAIASLGGIIEAVGIIPKTRSGKTLRRVLRELVENGARGHFDAPVNVPPTVEDLQAVERARGQVREYFTTTRPQTGGNRMKAKL